MKKSFFSLTALLLMSLPAIASDGVINVPSPFNVKETANRLENVLNEKGMTIFNRIYHSESAAKVGIELRETELILFGNPKAGSPLMKCEQSAAIDLPQKAMIWEDENHKVWISYNDPRYLEKRHSISGCEAVLSKTAQALSSITKKAVTVSSK